MWEKVMDVPGKDDLRQKGLSVEEAQDWPASRRIISNIDPT